MGTSETPEQLTIRLEMGQGRTVRFFIAQNSKEAEELVERRAVAPPRLEPKKDARYEKLLVAVRAANATVASFVRRASGNAARGAIYFL